MVRKSLSKRLFNRKFTIGEWIISLVGIFAGTITIIQNVFVRSTLSSGIEQNITNTPTNLWMLGIGILIFILTIGFIRKKRKK